MTQYEERPEERAVSTRGGVEGFARAMFNRSEHKHDCWLCGGQRFLRSVTGKLRKCGECGGSGVEAVE